jgi:hypothetical protein
MVPRARACYPIAMPDEALKGSEAAFFLIDVRRVALAAMAALRERRNPAHKERA